MRASKSVYVVYKARPSGLGRGPRGSAADQHCFGFRPKSVLYNMRHEYEVKLKFWNSCIPEHNFQLKILPLEQSRENIRFRGGNVVTVQMTATGDSRALNLHDMKEP